MSNEYEKNNIISRKHEIKIHNRKYSFEIFVDLDKFVPNASSLIYAGKKNTIIGWSTLNDYEIVFEVVGNVRMYDINTGKYYLNEISDYAKNTLITDENIENYGYVIEESNCFEISYLKKNKDEYEYYGGSDEVFTELYSSYENLIDLLFTETKSFIQDILGDY